MAPVGRFGSWVELAVDAVVLSAGAGDDLPDAVRVWGAARVELGEALVVVLVSVEHHVRVGSVQMFGCVARSFASQVSCALPTLQATWPQFEFNAIRCHVPRS